MVLRDRYMYVMSTYHGTLRKCNLCKYNTSKGAMLFSSNMKKYTDKCNGSNRKRHRPTLGNCNFYIIAIMKFFAFVEEWAEICVFRYFRSWQSLGTWLSLQPAKKPSQAIEPQLHVQHLI